MRAFGHWVGTGSLAVLLSGCLFPGDGPEPCDLSPNEQTDATLLVKDPIVGEHTGQLTWLETGKTVTLTMSVGFDGPAIKASDGCSGPYQVPVHTEVTSGDGLIEESQSGNQFLDRALRMPEERGSFVLDGPSLLAAGVAPAQPDFAQKNPVITLQLKRDKGSWTAGSVRAVTADEQVTLGVIAFGGGS